MRLHHTKNKGDLGVLHAQLDLVRKGYRILVPQSEHEWFDLVAYRDSRFVRVQVKYRAAVSGTIAVQFFSTWSDRHGIHKLQMAKTEVDVVCVYCPDTERCYYLDPRGHRGVVYLRLAPTKNNQSKRVLMADRFTDLPRTVEACAQQDSNLRQLA